MALQVLGALLLEAERIWPLRGREMTTVFRFQYALCEPEQTADFLTQRFRFGSRNLLVGKDLPVSALQDVDGVNVGYMLGLAVGPEEQISETHQFGFSQSDPEFWEQFETFLVDCAGRYTFLVDSGSQARVYCDPVGMNGVVFDPEAKRLASSPLLAIDRPVIPNQRYAADVLAEHKVRYTLFHTCDDKVKRLNPNYFLDLKTFEKTRFWPRDEDFSLKAQSHADTYDEIISRLAFNIKELTTHRACVMPISGGRDSRILASVGKDSLENVDLFYTHIKNYASEVDAHVGRGIAKSLGVEHVTLGGRSTDNSERWERNYLSRAYGVTHASEAEPPKEYMTGAIKSIPGDKVILRGHQTDLLRAVYVFRDKEEWRNHAWQLQRMLIVPRDAFNRDIAKLFKGDFYEWQETLPDCAMEKAADFMFLEVYYNSTVGASFPALWQHFYMSPYNSRRLISLSLRFDEKERRAGHPVYDIIQKCSPECARIPFTKEGGEHFPDNLTPGKFEHLSEKRVSETAKRLRRFYGATTNK